MSDYYGRRCQEVRASLDTGHETRRAPDEHLASCPACADEFGQRLRVKYLVQRAVRREVAPTGLAQNIRLMISETADASRRVPGKFTP